MLRRVARTIAKGLCGLALLAFFFAPMTKDVGWLICSIAVGIPCLVIWKKLEGDEDDDGPSAELP